MSEIIKKKQRRTQASLLLDFLRQEETIHKVIERYCHQSNGQAERLNLTVNYILVEGNLTSTL
jgi:hypothetical protein